MLKMLFNRALTFMGVAYRHIIDNISTWPYWVSMVQVVRPIVSLATG